MKELTKSQKYELEHIIKNLSKHLLKLNPNIKIERINEKTLKINGHILKLDNYAE